MPLRRLVGPLASVALGVGYGLLGRWIFGTPSPEKGLREIFVGVSIAFLFLVPFGLGVLTAAWAAPRDEPRRWAYWLLTPIASAVLLLASTLVLAWEGLICLVMAAPIVIFMAMLGGLVVALVVTRRRKSSAPTTLVASCLVLPFAFAPIEARARRPDDRRTVVTEIDVAAPPSAVWRQVVRVPYIRDEEQTLGFFHAIGIPRPLEAQLDREGVGGRREASFAGGVRFLEHVTEWEPERRLGFTIEVDAASIAPGVLDEHVRVGGPHFDVVYGRFELQPRGNGTHLVLLSRHHLRTTFNAYAGLWTDAVMRDVQRNICRVIRARSERGAPTS